jgi:hypothetical protein
MEKQLLIFWEWVLFIAPLMVMISSWRMSDMFQISLRPFIVSSYTSNILDMVFIHHLRMDYIFVSLSSQQKHW